MFAPISSTTICEFTVSPASSAPERTAEEECQALATAVDTAVCWGKIDKYIETLVFFILAKKCIIVI